MGKVKTTWLLPGHSGRPCHHEDIYTKMNKKTGQVYSVKLCNPSEAVTANQTAQRNTFGSVSKALSSWIATNKVSTATDHSAYQTVKAQYDRQGKYSTLRGYMMAKNMAAVQTDGSVLITIGSYTATVSGSTVSNGTSGGGTSATTYTVTLTASPSNGGTVNGGGSGNLAGSTVTISAVANSGYTFSSWSDGNTSATRTITVNADTTLTATFTATQSGGGSGENTGGGDDDEGGGF